MSVNFAFAVGLYSVHSANLPTINSGDLFLSFGKHSLNLGIDQNLFPMKYAQLPCETKSRPLPFYLAMEEYLAGLPCDDELFFMWQVAVLDRKSVV